MWVSKTGSGAAYSKPSGIVTCLNNGAETWKQGEKSSVVCRIMKSNLFQVSTHIVAPLEARWKFTLGSGFGSQCDDRHDWKTWHVGTNYVDFINSISIMIWKKHPQTMDHPMGKEASPWTNPSDSFVSRPKFAKALKGRLQPRCVRDEPWQKGQPAVATS